ncbi:Per1-like protein [Neocallimastix californiae]|jgi:hypothetical protein|uniref:Post-GPI attachment to proteins factor 3 n=1 Tax=Neocallimastix californiae TaxID=1754190 RepID=A0A1Y2D4V9_9FUNG|nr:Per1-like protein [Neocallimastix californiae]|eukprot:ORY54174.1 Per1-like protein [Neocallimastix californiae]
MNYKFIIVLLCSLLISSVKSSWGDIDKRFKECLYICNESICENDPPKLSLPLRLTFWSCEAECKYHCMFKNVEERQNNNERIVQYYGKWPFYRFLGMQEPASVLFSFFNLCMHYIGLKRLNSATPKKYYLRNIYTLNSLVGIYSWIASMIFHTRDNKVTEKMDYFGASASIICNCFVTIIRVFNIRSKKIISVIFSILFLYYIGHISYLTFWFFDYSYNIAACTFFGIIEYSLWLYWAYKNKNRPYVKDIVMTVLLTFGAMMFELFDFSPLFFITDAHSLWHLCTAIIGNICYNFYIADVHWETRKEKDINKTE